jgi:chromosome segregation ATPase
MDPIRESFNRVRQDIDSLQQQIDYISQEIEKNKKQMLEICELIRKLSEKTALIAQQQTSTYQQLNQALSTHISTHEDLFKALKPQILPISTGNQGVPTDRQTDRQTHRQTHISSKVSENIFPQQTPNPPTQKASTVDDAAEILESLDNIKKEIRLKFKRLTDQEFTIFSMIYQLEEERGFTDYKALAKKLNLTESSIRDYVGRIIRKGIPVEKKRVNNKTIQLSVSNNLKKIASLPTIMQLRDL